MPPAEDVEPVHDRELAGLAFSHNGGARYPGGARSVRGARCVGAAGTPRGENGERHGQLTIEVQRLA